MIKERLWSGRPRRACRSWRRALASLALASLLLLVLGSVSNAQVSGLVAAYSFNEGSGTTVADASGSGNSGTIGSATWTGAGKYGGALSFNGTNAKVTIPDAPSLRLTTRMTLEAWVNPSTIPNAWRDVLYKGDDNYYLSGSSSNSSRPAAGAIFSGSYGETFGTSALALSTWTHLATTYDGSTLRLWVNGVQVASKAQTGTIKTSSNPLTIGGDPIYGQYFSGLIDEVRVYNVALTQAQIQADMATAIGGGGGGDTQPPTVSITSPTAGATVSHVTTLTANASDNVGVLSVQFLVDGVSLGTDFTAPYSQDWNTTAASNGTHTITAVARDAFNQATSTPVTVTSTNPVFTNEVVVPDIADATTIAFLPGGRMLIGLISEKILVVQPGASAPDPTPFLQLDPSQLVGEEGIWDILPDPNFSQNGWYYVFYNKGASNHQNSDRLSRFTASGNGTVPGSEVVLWQDSAVDDSDGVHHGASIAIRQDGKIYFSIGDHLHSDRSQSLTSPYGKILRINPDGTVPTDNPFSDGAGPNVDAIWAYGLRNPFRMSVDPATDKLYVGEVGGNDDTTAIEEVEIGVRGANYGWPMCEGPCGVSGTTDPIYWYAHNGRDSSMTGGFVYRGSQFPSEYQGSYFFGDYAENTLKRLRLDGNGNVLGASDFWPADGSTDGPSVGDPVKLVQGPDGSLYYVDIGFDEGFVPNASGIHRIRYTLGNQPPVAVASANPTSGQAPLSVALSSAGSSDPEGQPLSYSWTFGDGGTSTAPNPTHVYQTSGGYVARLTVSDGTNSTISTGISVTVGSPPLPTISSPVNGSFFQAGNTIAFAGDATDPEDGTLPASAFTWTILFHHDTHIHPGGTITGTKSGTFQIPTSGHDFQGSTNYEFVLTVTDSTGITASTSVTVFPQKVNLTVSTVPSGLNIVLDGITKQTPFVLDDVVGFQHTINAPNQSSGGTSYTFQSWSDGGAQTHGITTPSTNSTLVATFQSGGSSPTPVAAYSFNEGSGTTVADASGSGNSGTIGSATWTGAGKYGGALSFNGSSAKVTIPDAPSLRLTTGMTLEAWVYPTSIPNAWRDAVYKGDDNYYLSTSSSPGMRPAAGGTFSGSVAETFGVSALATNTWTHLAATYDGSTLRLWLNGVQVSSKAQTGTLKTSSNPLTIGGDAIYGQYFAGRIDEVRTYNVALTQAQIQSDMASAIGGGGGSDTQPPTAPATLTATAVSSSQINLSWSAATDNVAVTGYRVERCQGAGCSNFAQIAAPSGTTFSDMGLSPSTSYSYRVRATDAAGNLGGYSPTASATTQAGAAGPTPVAAYSFNEGTGTTVADASGTGNAGTIGSTVWTNQGKYGNALTFNGTNAKVTIPDAPSLRLTSEMTLEAWVNPSAIPNAWCDLVYKGDDNYYLSTSSSTSSRPAGGGIFSGSYGETFGTSALVLTTWTHLANTYDGTTLRLWVNGVQVSSKAQTGTLKTSSNALSIGGDSIYGQYFSGLIDEVRVYNVALTQTQIQSDMATAITP
jgi:glucose/arabinose dehydrogenase/chitodextrinase